MRLSVKIGCLAVLLSIVAFTPSIRATSSTYDPNCIYWDFLSEIHIICPYDSCQDVDVFAMCREACDGRLYQYHCEIPCDLHCYCNIDPE